MKSNGHTKLQKRNTTIHIGLHSSEKTRWKTICNVSLRNHELGGSEIMPMINWNILAISPYAHSSNLLIPVVSEVWTRGARFHKDISQHMSILCQRWFIANISLEANSSIKQVLTTFQRTGILPFTHPFKGICWFHITPCWTLLRGIVDQQNSTSSSFQFWHISVSSKDDKR